MGSGVTVRSAQADALTTAAGDQDATDVAGELLEATGADGLLQWSGNVYARNPDETCEPPTADAEVTHVAIVLVGSLAAAAWAAGLRAAPTVTPAAVTGSNAWRSLQGVRVIAPRGGALT